MVTNLKYTALIVPTYFCLVKSLKDSYCTESAFFLDCVLKLLLVALLLFPLLNSFRLALPEPPMAAEVLLRRLLPSSATIFEDRLKLVSRLRRTRSFPDFPLFSGCCDTLPYIPKGSPSSARLSSSVPVALDPVPAAESSGLLLP